MDRFKKHLNKTTGFKPQPNYREIKKTQDKDLAKRVMRELVSGIEEETFMPLCEYIRKYGVVKPKGFIRSGGVWFATM